MQVSNYVKLFYRGKHGIFSERSIDILLRSIEILLLYPPSKLSPQKTRVQITKKESKNRNVATEHGQYTKGQFNKRPFTKGEYGLSNLKYFPT